MKKYFSIFYLVLFLLTSCSSGKKALQKGDYFSAVSKAVERLKSDPDNKKAIGVLKQGYPLAIEWAQEEMDQILSLNQSFKWGRALALMEDVNQLSDEIRQSPSARNIIQNPKVFTTELSNARERAAEERYNAGIEMLQLGSRESAREAYDNFAVADNYIHGYKDVLEKISEAKEIATLNVILEVMPVHARKYELTSAFFYDQVYEYLNHKFPTESFVNFYSPKQAELLNLDYPDMVVNIGFYDYVVGKTKHTEKEEELSKRVKVETRDTTRTHYKTYKAKFKTFTDEVLSEGILNLKIVDFKSQDLLVNDRMPGSFTWVNKYAMFVGDKEALSKEQLKLTKQKVAPLPSDQDLFIEFTKPIYDQLTAKLNRFFRKYN